VTETNSHDDAAETNPGDATETNPDNATTEMNPDDAATSDPAGATETNHDDTTASDPAGETETATVTVETADGRHHELTAAVGVSLRDALLAAGISPHGRYARRVNCGGRGLCATCGVRLADPPDPNHWHDDLADRFGYPRLSCQLPVREGMAVRIPDKRVWGGRSEG
jgi:ferredoxin